MTLILLITLVSVGENDIYSAKGATLTSKHLVIDPDTTDTDSLIIELTEDYVNTPVVVGIRRCYFNFSGILASSDSTLSLGVDNITADKIMADVVSSDSLVNRVEFTNASTNHFSTSMIFQM